MNITLENVNENDTHTTTGPTVRFDVVDNSTAAVRFALTIDEETHVNYPPQKTGAPTAVEHTLDLGVHPASVVIAAHDLDGRRAYDMSITVNGESVVRAEGTIPDGSTEDADLALFQLRVR